VIRSIYITPLIALLLIGCKRDDMADQPRGKPMRQTQAFADQTMARPLVPGTIARGQLPIRAARLAAAAQPPANDFPFPLTYEDLKRGQERYQIFCAVCHGITGNGDGMIVQRGFSPPPPFVPNEQDKVINPQRYARSQYLLNAPPGHVYDVITNGYGAMYSYGERVPPEDRWAVAAYVRVLQQARQSAAGRPGRMPTTLPAGGGETAR